MKNRSPIEIFDEAFHEARDPRSKEYRKGVLQTLEYCRGYRGALCCPYPLGTAQADAWFSGTAEGYALSAEDRQRGGNSEDTTNDKPALLSRQAG